jgi:hypothetical protein
MLCIIVHARFLCSDPASNDGLVLSVLDVSKRELYLSVEDRANIPHLCMPGAHALSTKIKECLSDKPGSVVTISSAHNNTSTAARKPVYTASLAQRAKTRAAHDAMTKHLANVADMAVAHQEKLLEQRRKIIEMADRMSREKSKPGWDRRSSFFGADQGSDDGEGDDSGYTSPAEVSRGPTAALSHSHSGIANSGSSAAGHGLNVSNHSTSSTGSGGPSGASTAQQSSVAAAFGKVLRPRTSSNEYDNDYSGNTGIAQGRKLPFGRPSISGGMPNLNLGQAGGVGGSAGLPSSRLIAMSKQSFKGHNKEEFLNKFLRTQVRYVSTQLLCDVLVYHMSRNELRLWRDCCCCCQRCGLECSQFSFAKCFHVPILLRVVFSCGYRYSRSTCTA